MPLIKIPIVDGESAGIAAIPEGLPFFELSDESPACASVVIDGEGEEVDFATQATLEELLAKVIDAPSTEAKQDAANILLASIDGHVDGIEGLLAALNSYIDGLEDKDYATQLTLAAVLAELTLVRAKTDNLDIALSTRTKPTDAQVIADGGGSITVDGSVSVSDLVPGVGATSLGKSEDAAAGDGDTGVMMLAVRKDVAATTVGADGDYHPLEVDANGRLHVIEPSAASIATSIGATNEAAAAADTSTSGLIGLFKRLLQRVTTLLAVFPSSLAVNSGAKDNSTVRVILATDQPALSNKLLVTPDLPSGASTAAKQPALGTAGTASTDVITTQGIAGGVPLAVAGTTVRLSATLTRPNDSAPYAVGDSVNSSTSAPTYISFANISRVASGSGYITKAKIVTDQVACVAQMRLWLFSTNVTPFKSNDNAAFLIKYADKDICLGYIDFPAMATEGASDCAQAFDASLRLAFTADANSTIYGLLETKTVFTPGAQQNFYITLTAEQN